MKPRQLKLFNLARAVAQTSTHDKARIGAVIIVGKDIVSVGVNGNKSHPLQKLYNKYRFDDDRARCLKHAEIDAIIKAKRDPLNDDGAAIYIYRELRTGVQGMCRPCAGCMRALSDYNIKSIFFSTEHGFAHEEIK